MLTKEKIVPQDLDINTRFQQALTLLQETRHNLFITGKAGVGKSTFLDYFKTQTAKNTVFLAPTGVAALNIRGQTIHHFFRFYIDVTPEMIAQKTQVRNKELYSKLETLVIDEISMVRADLLDCVDMFLKMHGRQPNKPFGGVQMVFVGDLYQLPPVILSAERDIFKTHYTTPYFFSARAMKNAVFDIIEFDKVYRQEDRRFIDFLNKIRNNSVEDDDLQWINKRVTSQKKQQEKNNHEAVGPVHLTTTNRKAQDINESRLTNLPGRTYYAQAGISGDFGKEYYPTLSKLSFKEEAQIMLLNNDSKKRWVNGSIGRILEHTTNDQEQPHLRVALFNPVKTVRVYPHTWEVYRFVLDENGNIAYECAGTFTQYPFRLSWAITIHKSQGKTFDQVVIDLEKGTFASGQMYVALSRCRTYDGVALKVPIQKQHIRADYRISQFLTGYHYARSEESLPLKEKIAHIQQALQEKQALKITYLQANDTHTTRVVLPLSVQEETYKNKQFIGMHSYCYKRQAERMFRVDRILTLAIVPKP